MSKTEDDLKAKKEIGPMSVEIIQGTRDGLKVLRNFIAMQDREWSSIDVIYELFESDDEWRMLLAEVERLACKDRFLTYVLYNMFQRYEDTFDTPVVLINGLMNWETVISKTRYPFPELESPGNAK